MDINTEKRPSVSVVVAAYNSEKYLRQTMDSILRQSLDDIEVICVDDGSVDETFSILLEYEARDHRVKVFQNKEQSDGAAMARNIGISKAKGEYLSVLDADDFFETDMLGRMYERACEASADVVLCDGWVFDEEIGADKEADFILRKEYLPKDIELFYPAENNEQLFLMTCGAAWNGMFRRTFIEENDIRFQNFHHADDLGFVYLAYACASRISILPARLLHYRKNAGTSQADIVYKWPDSGIRALENLKMQLEEKELFSIYSVAFAQLTMLYSIFYMDNMRSWGDYRLIYDLLRNKKLNEFGVNDVDEDKFRNHYWVTVRNLINKVPADEFLFRQTRGLPPFSDEEKWQDRLQRRRKLVIYGAGNIGTDVFCRFVREKKYTVSAWVDKNYEAIGYPVLSPDVIKDTSYDGVLIAIASEDVYEKVKLYLKGLGVSENKIFWIGDNQ